MRTGAASGCEGFFHEGFIYASDTELRDAALPFLSDGLDAREPTYVVLSAENNDLVCRQLGERDGLHYLLAPNVYVNPAATVKRYREVLLAEVARGVEQVRFITEVPHPGTGSVWDWWGRYESAANDIFADLPLWAICTYDERKTPSDVLDEVIRSHPYLAGPAQDHIHNSRYQPPSLFLDQRACPYRDALEAGRPLIHLTDPTPAQARRAAIEVASALLGAERSENLGLAVSEVVANAQLHGLAPVEIEVWAGSGRVVVAVKDTGTGVQDSTVGLAPVPGDCDGGRGLWIASQLCDHLTMTRSKDGFVVRLLVGTPGGSDASSASTSG